MSDSLKVMLDSNITKIVLENTNDTILKIINLHNTSNNDNYFNLNLLIPIIVAFIGGVVTLMQVRGNTISNARIEWIENLRSTIAEFCIFSEKVIMQISNMDFKSKQLHKRFYGGFIKDYSDYLNYSSEAIKFSRKIKLYLNAKEDKHRKIEILLDEIDENSSNCFTKYDDKYEIIIKEALTEIILLSKDIIKEEWEKSKSYFPPRLKNKCKEIYNEIFDDIKS